MPTIHGRPRRSPRIRLSPPAVTVAFGMPRAAQDRDARVDRMALGDPAKVDAHAGLQEPDRRGGKVHDHVTPVDRRQRRRDLGIGRVLAGPVVVQVADARVSDVEGPAGHLGELERPGDQPRELGVHRDRAGRRIAVHPGELALRLVGRHQRVDPVHLGNHGVDGPLGLGRILVPHLDGDARAHDRLFARVPVGMRGCGGGDKQGDRKAETAHHGALSLDDDPTVAQRLH